jgi:hypothetical protein
LRATAACPSRPGLAHGKRRWVLIAEMGQVGLWLPPKGTGTG